MRVIIFCLVICAIAAVGCSTMENSYRQASTVEDYEQFIKDHPDSPYVENAGRQIATLREKDDFQKAETINTKKSYGDFARKYSSSQSIFVKEAESRLSQASPVIFQEHSPV